jgi:hypothetical protein
LLGVESIANPVDYVLQFGAIEENDEYGLQNKFSL